MSSAPYPIDDSYDDVAPAPEPRRSVVPPPLAASTDEAITAKLERALLGAVLTVGLLPASPPKPDAFADGRHGATWAAILAVASRGDEPKTLQVIWELQKTAALDRAGGMAYVTEHLNSTDCSDLSVYARMVREASLLRKMNRLKA